MRSSNATVCIGKPPPPWFWLPHLVFKERRYAATLLSLKEWPQPRFCCEVDSARTKLCHRVIKLYEVRNVPNLDLSYVVEKGAILLITSMGKNVPNLDLSYVVEKGAILLITSMGKKGALIHPWKIDILISSFGAQDYRVLYGDLGQNWVHISLPSWFLLFVPASK